MPSPTGVPPRSGISSDLWQSCPDSHPARMQGQGNQPRRVPSRATRTCGHHNTWAARSGETGADTTAEVQVPIAIMNGFNALGIYVTKTVRQMCPQKVDARSATVFCSKAW